MLAQVHILRGEFSTAPLESLRLLSEIGATPDAQKVAQILADRRQQLGAEAFDVLWREVTDGQLIPAWRSPSAREKDITSE